MFDEESFNEIYRQYAARLRRYCLVRLSNDEVAAEEAASDVFVALYKRWDELDRDGNIGIWLIRCADLCIKRQKHKYGKYYARIEPIDDETLCAIHDPTSTADGEIAAKDLHCEPGEGFEILLTAQMWQQAQAFEILGITPFLPEESETF